MIPLLFSSLSLSLHLSPSPSHATDVFLRRSNRQESTGNKKALVFPRRDEHKAPSLLAADVESWSICHQPVEPLEPGRLFISVFA